MGTLEPATSGPLAASSGALGAALLSSALGSATRPPPMEAAPGASSVDPGIEALGQAHWTCSACKAQNSYTHDACATCGTSLFAPLVEKQQLKEISEDKVLTFSLVPGGGFFALGLNGAGAVRLMLTAWALGLGLMVPVAAVKVLFVVVGFGVWGVSAWDALVTSRGDRRSVLLGPKAMMGIVAGLLVLLVAGMVLAAPRPSLTPGAPPIENGGPVGSSPPLGN